MYQSDIITKTEIMVVHQALLAYVENLQKEVLAFVQSGSVGNCPQASTLELVNNMIFKLEEDYEYIKYPEW